MRTLLTQSAAFISLFDFLSTFNYLKETKVPKSTNLHSNFNVIVSKHINTLPLDTITLLSLRSGSHPTAFIVQLRVTPDHIDDLRVSQCQSQCIHFTTMACVETLYNWAAKRYILIKWIIKCVLWVSCVIVKNAFSSVADKGKGKSRDEQPCSWEQKKSNWSSDRSNYEDAKDSDTYTAYGGDRKSSQVSD